jgi:hypothetical protein
VTIALCVLILCTQALGAAANGSDLWHVTGTKIVSQEVQFSNGPAHLAGTVCLSETGDHLPGVVVLHHAGLATRLEPEVLRAYNELLHRVTGAVIDHLMGVQGYSLEVILKMTQEFGEKQNRVNVMRWAIEFASKKVPL